MREYYTGVKVTCDKCGDYSYLDNSSETREELESHVENYYVQENDIDLCLHCSEENNGGE